MDGVTVLGKGDLGMEGNASAFCDSFWPFFLCFRFLRPNFYFLRWVRGCVGACAIFFFNLDGCMNAWKDGRIYVYGSLSKFGEKSPLPSAFPLFFPELLKEPNPPPCLEGKKKGWADGRMDECM